MLHRNIRPWTDVEGRIGALETIGAVSSDLLLVNAMHPAAFPASEYPKKRPVRLLLTVRVQTTKASC